LRDRALIGVMVYTFARVNAIISMKVKDYFTQGRRGWVRLHEKGGKEHEVPCHHTLEKLLDQYLEAADIAADPDGPLFRNAGRETGQAHAMWQQDVHRMIQHPGDGSGHRDKRSGITLSRYRHHRLPEEQRDIGARAYDCQPRLPAHHKALRPAVG
jgi:integrase